MKSNLSEYKQRINEKVRGLFCDWVDEVVKHTDPLIINELEVPTFGPAPEFVEVEDVEDDRESVVNTRVNTDIPRDLRFLSTPTERANFVPNTPRVRKIKGIEVTDIGHQIATIGTGINTTGSPFYQASCNECGWIGSRRRLRHVNEFTSDELENLRSETKAFIDWLRHEREMHEDRMTAEHYAEILKLHEARVEDAMRTIDEEKAS